MRQQNFSKTHKAYYFTRKKEDSIDEKKNIDVTKVENNSFRFLILHAFIRMIQNDCKFSNLSTSNYGRSQIFRITTIIFLYVLTWIRQVPTTVPTSTLPAVNITFFENPSARNLKHLFIRNGSNPNEGNSLNFFSNLNSKIVSYSNFFMNLQSYKRMTQIRQIYGTVPVPQGTLMEMKPSYVQIYFYRLIFLHQ